LDKGHGQGKFRLLTDVAQEDQEALLALARDKVYGPGELVVREGEPHEGLYLIEEGSVEVVRTGEEPGGSEGMGVEEALTRLGAGNFFGDLSVFDEGLATATVRTARECKILLLPRERFLGFLDAHPRAAVRLYRNIIREMATRLRRLDAKLVERIVWVQREAELNKGGGQ
jgi:CRP-like cAMP-binding protein